MHSTDRLPSLSHPLCELLKGIQVYTDYQAANLRTAHTLSTYSSFILRCFLYTVHRKAKCSFKKCSLRNYLFLRQKHVTRKMHVHKNCPMKAWDSFIYPTNNPSTIFMTIATCSLVLSKSLIRWLKWLTFICYLGVRYEVPWRVICIIVYLQNL